MVPHKLKWIVNLNPLSAQFELFRYSILGTSGINSTQFLYGFIFMLIILTTGILTFNKMGDRLMDVA
jgi:lipopolysaccharide transport system permease protein